MFVLLAMVLAVFSLVLVAYLLSWWIQRRELETVRASTVHQLCSLFSSHRRLSGLLY